jgi:hypothetical protein
MGEYINIIKSDIVDAKYDSLWNYPEQLKNITEPKPVLVITNTYEAGSAETIQLQKMLAACKLSNDQYNIIALAEGQTVGWHQLRERLHPKFIFLIGILPAQLGVSASFRLNEPNNFNDRIWLPALSLSELEKNPSVKSQLWSEGMKPVFIDKKYGAIEVANA